MSAQERARRFALLLLIFLFMLLLNIRTPLMMDDYDYSFSWSTGERLDGVYDIIASQAAHYRLWGGRSVTHFLAQLFLYMGKPAFNIANAAMYVLLLLEIALLARKKGTPVGAGQLLIAHTLLFCGVEFFGVAFLWLDGACNYLWGTALALLPLLIAKSEREGGFFDAGMSRGVLALPVSLIAGWTNENTACGVLAATALLLLADALLFKRRIRAWRVLALLCQAAGVALMLLAPGNFARAAAPQERGMIMELVYRFAVVSYCLIRYAGLPALLCAAALLAARRRRAELPVVWLCALLGCALLCAYVLVGSPQISDRSFTGVIALLIAALLAALSGVKTGKRTACACLALCLAFGAMACVDVTAHGQAWSAEIQTIEAAAARGEAEACVSSVPARSRYTMDVALGENPQDWPNSTLGKYYGIRIIGP